MTEQMLYEEVKQFNTLKSYNPATLIGSGSVDRYVCDIRDNSSNKYIKEYADTLLKVKDIYRSSFNTVNHKGNMDFNRLMKLNTVGDMNLSNTQKDKEYSLLEAKLKQLEPKIYNSIIDKFIKEGYIYYVEVRERLESKSYKLRKQIGIRRMAGKPCIMQKNKLEMWNQWLLNSSCVSKRLFQ